MKILNAIQSVWQIISKATQGIPPLVVDSTTKVNNLNVDLVDGFHASQTNAANNIVVRDSNGFITTQWLKMSRGDETTAAASYVYDSGDGYLRKKSLANAKSELITSAAIISALGFTPYNATNPNGYVNANGTVAVATNADTVDGKHASDFAPSGFGLGTVAQGLANGTDLNTVKTTGFYRVNAGVNIPPRVTGDNSNIWHFLIVVQHDTNYLVQIVFEYSTGVMFTRSLVGGTWNSWQTGYSTSNKPTPADIGASPSTHNHDSKYMKKGPLTWNDIEGV